MFTEAARCTSIPTNPTQYEFVEKEEYYFGSLTRLQIVFELNRLLADIENDLILRGGNKIEAGVDLKDTENFSLLSKWFHEGDGWIFSECFRDASRITSPETIRLSLIWLLQEISCVNKDNPTEIFSDPKYILKPFLDTISCPKISLSVCIGALDNVAMFLQHDIIPHRITSIPHPNFEWKCFIAFHNKPCIRYIKNRITLGLYNRKNLSHLKSDVIRNRYFASLLRILRVIISKDINSDVFDIRDLWSIMESMLRFLPDDERITTYMHEIIDYLSLNISLMLKKYWLSIRRPLEYILNDRLNGNLSENLKSFDDKINTSRELDSGLGPVKNNNEEENILTSYADSIIKSIRSTNSRVVRSCRSVNSATFDSDSELQSYKVDLLNLDPLTGIFNTNDSFGIHKNTAFLDKSLKHNRSSIRNIRSSTNSSTRNENSSTSDRGERQFRISNRNFNNTPENESVLIRPAKIERALSEIMTNTDKQYSRSKNFLSEYSCTFCNMSYITIIIDCIVNSIKTLKSSNASTSSLQLRLLDQIIKNGHSSLSEVISLGRDLYEKEQNRMPHILSFPSGTKIRLQECPCRSFFESNMDYFCLKKCLSRNMMQCGNALLTCLTKSYILLSEGLFSAIYKNLIKMQTSRPESGLQLPLIREQINFLGNIFSSKLSLLLLSQIEWYLVWIIKNFDNNAAIDNPRLTMILGNDSRIYNLEIRRGDQGNLNKNYKFLSYVLDSTLVIFSNANISRYLYLKCDANERSTIYLLEDFSFFVTKLCMCTNTMRDSDDTLNSIKIKCCRLLITVLYQHMPDPNTLYGENAFSKQYDIRNKRLLKDTCISILNLNIEEGLKKLQEHDFLPKDYTETDLAKFLYSNNMIDRFTLWSYISDLSKKNLLNEFVTLFDFVSMNVHNAIRVLVERVLLSGESQQISRLLEAFSSVYFDQNKDTENFVPKSSDAVYILTYAIVMLNTDLHNEKVANKMKFEDFARNLSGMNAESDFPYEFLRETYDSISKEEISGVSCVYDMFFRTKRYDCTRIDISNFTRDTINVWNREISTIILRPTLAVVYTRFKYVKNVLSSAYLSNAYQAICMTAMALNDVETINAIVHSLGELSNINIGFPDTFGYYQEQCFHCGNSKQLKSKKSEQFENIAAHFDIWSVNFGSDIKAQLATILLFDKIMGTSHELLYNSWTLLISLMQTLFLHAILPKGLIYSPNLFTGESHIQLVYPNGAPKNKEKYAKLNFFIGKKDLFYIKDSISRAFGVSSAPVHQFQFIERSELNFKRHKMTLNCVLKCRLDKIIDRSRDYSQKTLLALCESLIKTSYVFDGQKGRSDSFKKRNISTSSPPKLKNATKSFQFGKNIENGEGLELDASRKIYSDDFFKLKKYNMAAAFNLSLLFKITIRNMLRYVDLISLFEMYVMDLLSDVDFCPENLYINALNSIFSLILKLLYHEEHVDLSIRLAEKLGKLKYPKYKDVDSILELGMYMVLNHPSIINCPSIKYRLKDVKPIKDATNAIFNT